MLGEWIAHESPLQRGFVIGYAVIILASMVYMYRRSV